MTLHPETSTHKITLNFDLISPRLRNVSHPSVRMIPSLIIYPQKSHMHPRRRKHGHLKLHIDRRTIPRLRPHQPYQFHVRRQHALGRSREPFDSPHDGVLFRFVFGPTEGILDFGFGCVFRDGDFDDDVGSEEFVGEVGYDFQVDGAFGLTLFLHGRNQSERQIDIIIDPIPHQFELPIGGNEGNCPIRIEFSEPHASVKRAIVDFNPRLLPTRR
mmetsp:Transcript_6899/g.15243  ORF Transcript_6899/g.15243 Transcript_6899/m.15243 type:complete len:215 (-) Transcript_6899:502-1146(-)